MKAKQTFYRKEFLIVKVRTNEGFQECLYSHFKHAGTVDEVVFKLASLTKTVKIIGTILVHQNISILP